MPDVEITIRLPEALVKQATELGILSSEHIERLLRADIQAQLTGIAHDSERPHELREIDKEFQSSSEFKGLDEV
jgi:hypothetical protein